MAGRSFGGISTRSGLNFYELGSNNRTASFTSPSSLAASYSVAVPLTAGSSGQFLQTNGSNQLTWANVSSSAVSHTGLSNLDSGTYTDGGHTYLAQLHSAAVPPTTSDDSTAYKVGTVWTNTGATPKDTYLCVDNTASNAVWHKVLYGGGPLTASVGAVDTPSIYFTGDTDTGLYYIGSNNFGASVGGIKILDIANTGLSVGASSGTSPLKLASGSYKMSFTQTALTADHALTLPNADVDLQYVPTQSVNTGSSPQFAYLGINQAAGTERLEVTGNIKAGTTVDAANTYAGKFFNSGLAAGHNVTIQVGKAESANSCATLGYQLNATLADSVGRLGVHGSEDIIQWSYNTAGRVGINQAPDTAAALGVMGQTLLYSASPSATNPNVYFKSDETSTGLYRIGANNLGVSVSTAKILDIANTGLLVGASSGTAPLRLQSGSYTVNFDVTSLTDNRIITVPNANVNLGSLPDQALGTTSSPQFAKLGINQAAGTETLTVNGTVSVSAIDVWLKAMPLTGTGPVLQGTYLWWNAGGTGRTYLANEQGTGGNPGISLGRLDHTSGNFVEYMGLDNSGNLNVNFSGGAGGSQIARFFNGSLASGQGISILVGKSASAGESAYLQYVNSGTPYATMGLAGADVILWNQSGKVGINQAPDAAYTFAVNGNIRTNSSITTSVDGATSYALAIADNTIRGQFCSCYGAGNYFANAVAGDIGIRQEDTNYSILFGCGGGNSTMTIKNGKVGINRSPTSEITDALEVAGTIKAYYNNDDATTIAGRFLNAGVTTNGDSVYVAVGKVESPYNCAYLSYVYNSTGSNSMGRLGIWGKDDVITWTYDGTYGRFRSNPSYDTGIFNPPSQTGYTTAPGMIECKGLTTDSGHAVGLLLNSTYTGQARLWRIVVFGGDGSYRIRDDTGGADRFVIDTSGRVGINQASGTEVLEVNGNVKATVYKTSGTNVFVGNGISTSVSGASNVIAGDSAGSALTSGVNNVLIGKEAGHFNLSYVTDQSDSISIGTNSCGLGNSSIVIGKNANTATDYSIAIGRGANVNGTYGIAIGQDAYVNMTQCVSIGYNCGNSSYTNCIVLNTGGTFMGNTANNQIMIGFGGSYVYTSVGANSWTWSSDERLKKNIVPCPLGLDFITKINPIKFEWIDTEGMDAKTHHGFSYQQIQQVCTDMNIENFDGIAFDGKYGSVASGILIAPLVVSVKELNSKIVQQQATIDSLNLKVELLISRIEALESKA